ncbi:unnamed protein product [Cylicocyclus nassatus]|uniref:Uncharacterized protein n=1 Tax=Cylicocyclus nassatus TaxID=53992 RepID=A0AA36DR17_CYLNA|nr:unnamed protein product [Cylicocyclus nassatus]
MSMKRRSFLVKLMKLVGRGNQVQSSKACLAQIYESRKRQRQRTLLSSHLFRIKPMPTIMEEDESAYRYEFPLLPFTSKTHCLTRLSRYEITASPH